MAVPGHRSLHRSAGPRGPISLRGPMALRSTLVLLIVAAGLAIAGLWPMQRAAFGPFTSTAPDDDFARSALKSPADDDARMVALRRQAISALSQLRTGTDGARR